MIFYVFHVSDKLNGYTRTHIIETDDPKQVALELEISYKKKMLDHAYNLLDILRNSDRSHRNFQGITPTKQYSKKYIRTDRETETISRTINNFDVCYPVKTVYTALNESDVYL